MIRFVESIGRSIIGWITIVRELFRLNLETLYWVIIGPFKGKRWNGKAIIDQMTFMGVQSIVIVFFVTFFTGVVLAMQSAQQLAKMNGTIYVASLTTISICRELGPVLTALVLAGRVGAAITAEIGSMKVNEQLEALETMAINPVRFLVVPKSLSLLVMLPCLTIFGNLSGILGGYAIGVFALDINTSLYWSTAMKFLTLKDIYTGMTKPFVFAMIIAMVGAYQGLKTRGGAVGVGKATTDSVVTSFILIILADCIVTGVYYFANF